jgi:hypothetical protein
MLKMMNLIDIGERAGSGIPNIYRVWHDQNWQNRRLSNPSNRKERRYRYFSQKVTITW